MTTALVAGGAALVTLAVVMTTFLVVSRRSRSEERVAAVVAELNARMESMIGELTSAIERAEEGSRRTRALAELSGSIDLDEVLSRTLEAAGALSGVDAALISVEGPDGKPLVATIGLSAEEAERQAVAGPPDGRRARSISIAYRYTKAELDRDDKLIHSGLAVPLPSEAGPIGFITLFTRSSARTFGDSDVESVEALAARAGPAIENARRFREARQLADLDALTGLHNRRYFHETLSREVARANRYDRELALIVFDLDDFKEVNDRIGHLAGDSVLAEVAERVRGVVRSADIACRVGGDEFAVILPESALDDADQLYRRIEGAVSNRPVADVGTLHLSAGVAGLLPADDAASFFQRADNALYRAKERGKGQVAAANT